MRILIYVFELLYFIQCVTFFCFISHYPLLQLFMLFHLTQKRFSQSTHLLMYFSLYTLTSIIRTGSSFLMELIDLVNSDIPFLSQMTLFRLLTFEHCFSQSCSFELLLPSESSIYFAVTFTPLGSSDPAVVSVSIDFLSNLKGM